MNQATVVEKRKKEKDPNLCPEDRRAATAGGEITCRIRIPEPAFLEPFLRGSTWIAVPTRSRATGPSGTDETSKAGSPGVPGDTCVGGGQYRGCGNRAPAKNGYKNCFCDVTT